MKNKFMILLAIIALVATLPQQLYAQKADVVVDNNGVTTYTQKNDNGTTATVYSYNSNFHRTGTWLFYDDNGDLMKELNYRNNQLNGSYKVFYADEYDLKDKEKNDPLVEMNFTDGKADGEFKANSYKNKSISAQGSYIQGKRDGIWNFYNDDNTNVTGSYTNGKMDGVWTASKLDGKKIFEVIYSNNDLKSATYYHENGNIKRSGSVKEGYFDGIWQEYTDTGEPKEEINYTQKNKTKIGTDLTLQLIITTTTNERHTLHYNNQQSDN